MAAQVTAGLHLDVRRSGVVMELAAISWGPIAGAVAVATFLAIVDLTVWAGGPGSMLTWVCAALLGGAAALAFDEPAGAVAQAAPYPAGLRISCRLLVAACGGLGWFGYAWAVSAGQPRGTTVSWSALATTGVALLLAGPASALALSGSGNRDSGGLIASVLVAVVIGLLVVPLPRGFEPLHVADAWSHATLVWVLVAVVSAAVLVRASRA